MITQSKLNQALRHDQAIARALGRKRSEGLSMSVSRAAFLNAVKANGIDILTPAGEEYWKDQARHYPHLNLLATGVDTGDNPSGTRCRFGRVKERMVGGVWYKNVHNTWVKE